jgi:hypothetical protein
MLEAGTTIWGRTWDDWLQVNECKAQLRRGEDL